MTCIYNSLFPSVPTPTIMLSIQRARQKLEMLLDDTAVNGHRASNLLSGPLTHLVFIRYHLLLSLLSHIIPTALFSIICFSLFTSNFSSSNFSS